MNKLFTVTEYELLRYFTSPLAYVYLIAFLLLNGSFAVYFGNFFERGQADLLSMFVYHPWLYLLFIPGISMRLWSEEFRSRTIVQIATMPVSIPTLVIGKFLASLTFCTIALILTFPFWITVNILGTPDNGVIALSYFGSLMLAACMLGISQTMSALTKNQVIALVLSVVANLIFFLSGIEFVLAFFRLFAPLSIVDMIASFSFLTHFNSITQGLLELRDLVFFASIIILFNFITVLVISFKTSGTSSILKSNSKPLHILTFVFLLLGFVGLNLFANNFMRKPQFDFTYNNKFELSRTTAQILRDLKEPVTAKLYYSRDLEKRNPDFRLMFDEIRLKLEEFAKASAGKFNYIIYNPEFLSSEEDMAYGIGLQPIPIIDQNQTAFFGICFNDAVDNQSTIPFLTLERKPFIEQDLIEKIYTLNHGKKTIGLISSLPIFDTYLVENYVSPRWEIINQISQFYNVKKIQTPEDLENINVLMIVHPKNLDEKLIDGIKTYTDNGGNSLILLDVAAEAPRIYMPVNQEFYASDSSYLEELFGFKFDKDVVIGDLENSIMVDITKDYKKSPAFTQDIIQSILKKNNLNPEMPEVKNLDAILFASASSISPTSEDINFIPLIATSPNSAYYSNEVIYRHVSPELLLSSFKPDNKQKIIAAKITNKANKAAAIVVGDTDFMYDSFWSKTVNILDTNYNIPLFDNINFVLNSLESLSNDFSLSEIRKSSQEDRPFTDVERLRKLSQQQFKIKEAAIFDKIDSTKLGLQEILNKRNFEERDTFSPDELALIAKLRKSLDEYRKELGQIRFLQRASIDKIDLAVKSVNIYLIPIILLALLFLISINKKSKSAKAENKLGLTKQANIIFASCLALFAVGIYAGHHYNQTQITGYFGEFVFPDMPEKVNKINKITLRTNQKTLAFIKDESKWTIKDIELPVYQERIRNFLDTLIHAKYFEKKSDKLDHLVKFNLDPHENKASKAVLVELKDARNNILYSFYIGRYDVDIGRGGKAAYIRFKDESQVWLVEMDLIDLSLNWQDWSYSTAWNLRFGRFVGNGQTVDQLTELAKTLLNTHFISENKTLENPKPIFAIPIATEDNSILKLDFFESGGKFYLKYRFDSINSQQLNFFSDYVKNAYMEISQKDFERIKNAAPKP